LKTKEYEEITETPERTARRYLNELVSEGLAHKDGVYYVLKV